MITGSLKVEEAAAEEVSNVRGKDSVLQCWLRRRRKAHELRKAGASRSWKRPFDGYESSPGASRNWAKRTPGGAASGPSERRGNGLKNKRLHTD